jgi:hypothetical protein
MVDRWRLEGDDAEAIRDLAADDACLAHLVTISALLSGLFRDRAVELEWLTERKPSVFDGLSAMMLILDGPKGLQRVCETVRYMSGQ